MKTKQTEVIFSKDSFQKNEAAANIAFAKSSLFAALILFLLWIGYLAGLFNVSDKTLSLVNIVFPFNIVLYVSTIIYTKTKWVYKKHFKYFLLIQFVLCIGLLNIVIPKHAIIGWAVCLAFAAHYYSPKTMKIIFIAVLIAMFFCLYLAMFYGEWDANLMNGTGTYTNVEAGIINVPVDELSPSERFIYLHDRMVNYADNRYLKVLYFYYLSRVVALTILFIVMNALSKRSLRLLNDEIAHVQAAEKISNELSVASNIQLGVLPSSFPDNSNCLISAVIKPAKEVGGDFYDYFKIDDNHIALVIADVSGKGVPAALFMMKTETLIKSLAFSHKNHPATILEKCNNSLCEGNEQGMFVTCWFGILNTLTGELNYCNAGHNLPLITHGEEVIFLGEKKQIVLGAFANVKYKDEFQLMEEGDKLLLYTDGVSEAHDINGALFGENRLKDTLKLNVMKSAPAIIESLSSEVESYSGEAPQFDDITILCCEYKKSKGDRSVKTYTADVKNLDDVLDFVSEFFNNYGFSAKEIRSVMIAVEEAFVNICHYAYKGIGPIDVALIHDSINDEIFIELKDMGIPFNPLLRDDPDITSSSEERDIGGLGIFMVKKIMDDVSYKYIDNHNVLILGKKKTKI